MLQRKRWSKIIFMSLLVLLFVSSVALAQEVTVKGAGASREDAIRDALRLAVEQSVGTLINSETVVQNYTVIKDEIYSKSRGFVQEYQVLQEQRENGQVTVVVRATVDASPSSSLMAELQRLQLIEVSLRDPRIAVIIPEYHISARIPDPAGETAVIRKLIDAGFSRMVDIRQVQDMRYTNVVKAILQGNRQEALGLAGNLGVDYLIIGEGVSQYVGNIEGSGILSSRARIEGKLIKADTGEIIAANGTYGSGVDITEYISAKKALNNAGEALGDYMVKKLMNLAGNPEKGVQIVVSGVTSFSKVNLLEQELRNVSGVKAVFVRSYNNGVVTMDLNYTGSPKILATALEKCSVLNIRIGEITNSIVRATIK